MFRLWITLVALFGLIAFTVAPSLNSALAHQVYFAAYANTDVSPVDFEPVEETGGSETSSSPFTPFAEDHHAKEFVSSKESFLRPFLDIASAEHHYLLPELGLTKLGLERPPRA